MSKKEVGIKGAQFLTEKTRLEDVFTPEEFSEQHKMIAKTSKQFATEVDRYRGDMEKNNYDCVVKLMHKAGRLGLLAHSIPKAYGGLELDKITKGIVGEMIGATGSYAVAHSNHTCIATLPVTYFGTREQKTKYLDKLASGEYIGAYCLTEPEAGSDALGAKTTAYLNSEKTHYILNGTKQFITNAEFSDTFIVYANVDGNKFSAFIVEKDFPGLNLGMEEQKMGLNGSSTRSVIFEDCKVPVQNLIGKVGKGHKIALNVLNLGRFNLGSVSVGAAKKALEETVKYTKSRKQFDKAIIEFSATMEKLAYIQTEIYAAESLQFRTANLLEDALGDLYDSYDHELIGKRMMEYAVECAICKVYGSEVLDYTVDEAVQLHGGYGYIKDYRVEQFYRDSRINRIFEGTNEINRLLIPNFLFKNAEQLNLYSAIEKSFSEIGKNKYISKSIMDHEKSILNSIRRTFLVLLGIVFKLYGKNLNREQEIIMKLSDIAIYLYAAESTVLRSLKAIKRNGNDKEELKMKLATAYINNVLTKVEKITRDLLSGLLKSEETQKYTKLIRIELGQYDLDGGIKRNRVIAERVIKAGGYVSI